MGKGGSNRGGRGRDSDRDDRDSRDSSRDSKDKGPKDRPPKKTSEYPSPVSFLDAWTNFFTPAAIMLVTSLGLIIEKLPALHSLPFGGCLMQCVSAWKCITENQWVRNVARFGYKIPLKITPRQKRIPENPPASGEAFDVLVAETKGLLEKGAIVEVAEVPGQFVSAFFAVPKPRSEKWRPIINLKYFNAHIRHYKFRMETFKMVREWLQPDFYLIGLDLKDMFLSVGMNKRSQKFYHFKFQGSFTTGRVCHLA